MEEIFFDETRWENNEKDIGSGGRVTGGGGPIRCFVQWKKGLNLFFEPGLHASVRTPAGGPKKSVTEPRKGTASCRGERSRKSRLRWRGDRSRGKEPRLGDNKKKKEMGMGLESKTRLLDKGDRQTPSSVWNRELNSEGLDAKREISWGRGQIGGKTTSTQ